MLDAAHAAAFHWAKVGQPIHAARADLLLAHVHSRLGHGDRAMHYARRVLEFCESNECEDWDLAFAHAEVAHAAARLGDDDLHARHHRIAAELGEVLKDEEDRKVFRSVFDGLPALPQ